MSKEIKDTERYLSYEEGCDKFRNDNGEMLYSRLPIVHRLYYLKHYLGVLLTSIEVLGLPERQEKSFKAVVKRNFWEFVQEGFIVPGGIDNILSPSMEEIIGDDTPILTEEEAVAAGVDVACLKDAEDNELGMLNV